DDVFDAGAPVTFIGSGDDPDGADLEESAFAWSSDVDGPIGTGREVSSVLSAGEHIVTLTVTDPQTLQATASVAITITP
ncbi:MAG: hypothetical protein P8049_12070, partial [Gemmatimonadota bacterium]